MGPRSLFTRVPRAAPAAEVRLGDGWVRPAWLERQLDPTSSNFVPQGHLPGYLNLTDRSWTGIGNIASPRRAVVDPRGLLTPSPGSWSLDWWIGAEDRWHFPSRDAAVRQGLVGTSPVTETLLRVPGGDAVSRSYTVVGPGDTGDLAIMEIENRSAVPFAVAFAIRPYNSEGLARIERIDLEGDDLVTVDGEPALWLPRAPSAAAGSTFDDGDVPERLAVGLPSSPFVGVRCAAGMAQAVFVFPLSHTSSIRVALPLAGSRPEGPVSLPPAVGVAKAWDAQTNRGTRFVLPPGRLTEAMDANRKHLLLAFTGDDLVVGPSSDRPPPLPDTNLVLRAFGVMGFAAEARDVIHELIARRVEGDDFGGPAANGAVLAVMAEHWRLTREPDFPAAARDAVVLAGRQIVRERPRARDPWPRRRRSELSGLLPARPEATGEPRFHYADDFWAVRGLLDGAELLLAAGDDSAAARLAAEAVELEKDLRHSLAAIAQRSGSFVIPGGPEPRGDRGSLAGLLAWSLGLLAPDDPHITATLDALREGPAADAAVVDTSGHNGLSPLSTLRVAAVEAARGDRRALDRLRWLLQSASDTLSWPEAIHPTHRGGTYGEGQDLRVSAAFLLFIRRLLVQEVVGPSGVTAALTLCPMLPPEWEGQAIEVHDAPTDVGPVSFAVRWHGPRPALLWDVRAHEGVGPVTLSAPALDRDWSSIEAKGEVLLAASGPATGPG